MKFDKVYNDLFNNLGLNEMAIHLHNEEPIIDPSTGARARHSPRNASQKNLWSRGAPEIGVDSPEEKQSKTQRFKDSFKQVFAARFKKKMDGEAKGWDCYTMTDLTDSVKKAASLAGNVSRDSVRPDVVYDVFIDNLVNNIFPGGVNPARNWDEFTDPQGEVTQATKQAFIETADHFSNLLGVSQLPGFSLSKGARLGYFIKNILKNVIIDSGAVLSDIDNADYLEGSKASRGRKSAADQAAELAQPGFEMHNENTRLDEMPVRLRQNAALGDKSGLDTMKRVMQHTFTDKHRRVGDELPSVNVSAHQRDGSQTYHVGNLARHLTGASSIHEVPESAIQQASDIFAEIVHNKMFEVWNGSNPATNKKEFRSLMTQAVEEAIKTLEDQYGVDVFEKINNLPEFTARIIDNGLKDMFATVRTGYDDTTKTWNKPRPGSKINENEEALEDEEEEDSDETPSHPVKEAAEPEDDDNEDEEYDEDEESEDEDVAYKQGILKDEEEQESEDTGDEAEEEEEEDAPSEEEEENAADVVASRIEQTGRDIAQLFLQALDDLENEEDSEEDDIVDDEVSDDDEDIRQYLGGSHNVEDEEEERYRDWGNFNDEEY